MEQEKFIIWIFKLKGGAYSQTTNIFVFNDKNVEKEVSDLFNFLDEPSLTKNYIYIKFLISSRKDFLTKKLFSIVIDLEVANKIYEKIFEVSQNIYDYLLPQGTIFL